MFEFTARIVDEITGALLIEELPCQIEAHVDAHGDIQIDDITVDGVSLYKGSPLSAAVAGQVVEQVMESGEFLEGIGAPAWGDVEKRAELGTW